MSGLPVTINAKRARVLVVGGGAPAVRAATAAAEAGATVRIVDANPDDRLRALAARGPAVTLEARDAAGDDVAWATLVFAASDDAVRNVRIGELAHAAGKLVSVAGDSAASTFTSPETIRAGALTIAIAAGDLEPLARHVRERIAERIGAAYADAVEGLTGLRRELLARGDADRWTHATESLLDDDVCVSIERGSFARRLAAWR